MVQQLRTADSSIRKHTDTWPIIPSLVRTRRLVNGADMPCTMAAVRGAPNEFTNCAVKRPPKACTYSCSVGANMCTCKIAMLHVPSYCAWCQTVTSCTTSEWLFPLATLHKHGVLHQGISWRFCLTNAVVSLFLFHSLPCRLK